LILILAIVGFWRYVARRATAPALKISIQISGQGRKPERDALHAVSVFAVFQDGRSYGALWLNGWLAATA
jgi:hypothetical protein